jgi:hypothetical protein
MDPSGDTSNDDDADEQTAQEAAINNKAVEETVRSLIKRESTNAINAAKKKDFAAWINKNYTGWEAKLADKLEAIGLDRDLAVKHCQESAQALALIAARTEPDQLQQAISTEVRDWSDRRIFSLMGLNK